MSDKIRKFFCADCIWQGKGQELTEVEWIHHLSKYPTHMPALDEVEDEYFNIKNGDVYDHSLSLND